MSAQVHSRARNRWAFRPRGRRRVVWQVVGLASLALAINARQATGQPSADAADAASVTAVDAAPLEEAMPSDAGGPANLNRLEPVAERSAPTDSTPAKSASEAWPTFEIEATGWRKRALELEAERFLATLKDEHGKTQGKQSGPIVASPTNQSLLIKLVDRGRVLGFEIRSAAAASSPTLASGDLVWRGDGLLLASLEVALEGARAREESPPPAVDGAASLASFIPTKAMMAVGLLGFLVLASALGFRRIRRPKSAPLRPEGSSATKEWFADSRVLVGLGTAAFATLCALAILGALNSVPPSLLAGGFGAAWGWFAVQSLASWFPPLRGLGRVPHTDVLGVLRLWSWVALGRALSWLVANGPLIAVACVLAAAFGATLTAIVLVVVPSIGLLLRLWWYAVVTECTEILDAEFHADAGVDWEDSVRGYLLGYIGRQSWVGGEELQEGVRMFASSHEGVIAYGGGARGARIAIDRELLEFALAPYGRPHDYHAPREDKLFWSGWNAGLVVPVRNDPKSDGKTRVEERLELEHHNEPGDMELLHLGQPPTLAGFVEPSALDDRASHRPTEDPTWLDWEPGNDFDGTDPGDHDFLFGALVHRLGQIDRRGARRRAVSMVLGPLWRRRVGDGSKGMSALARRIRRLATWPSRLAFEASRRRLADATCELNFARYHFAQFLAWQRWRDESLMSARAFAPELERRSRDIARALDREGVVGTTGAAPGATINLEAFGDRLRALLGGDGEGRRRRRLVPLVGVAAAVLALVALGVVSALTYDLPSTSVAEPTSGHSPGAPLDDQ